MKKNNITQWQYNKLMVLFGEIKGKYLELVRNDIDAFCEREGIDLRGLFG